MERVSDESRNPPATISFRPALPVRVCVKTSDALPLLTSVCEKSMPHPAVTGRAGLSR